MAKDRTRKAAAKLLTALDQAVEAVERVKLARAELNRLTKPPIMLSHPETCGYEIRNSQRLPDQPEGKP